MQRKFVAAANVPFQCDGRSANGHDFTGGEIAQRDGDIIVGCNANGA
jgi:hypothetical protein